MLVHFDAELGTRSNGAHAWKRFLQLIISRTGGGSSGGISPLNTKGDLFTYSTLDARLGVGTDGYVLTADALEPTGIKWASIGASLPVYANNAAALTGGLTAGDLYKTAATGDAQVMVVNAT